MGYPENLPEALAGLRARFPAWEIVHVPPLTPHDSGGLCASRRVHPALETLATWSGTSASTPGELETLLAHLDSLAEVATGCLMARDQATADLLDQLESYLRPL